MLILSEKKVKELLNMRTGIAITEKSYEMFDKKQIRNFPRCGGDLNEDGGAYIILPAAHQKKGYFGFKYASSYPTNPSKGVPTVASCILLCSLENGFPVALVGANWLTGVKTASSSAVATKHLSVANASVMGIIGAGLQSRFQVNGVSCVRDIRELRIFDLDPSKSQALGEWFHSTIDDTVVLKFPGSVCETVNGADIITTITTSFKPVLTMDGITAGAHINAMGSFLPEMQELDDGVVESADLIATDVIEDTWKVAGDLLKPLSKGVISRDALNAELGGIVSDRVPGRENSNQITIFESVGFSALDVAMAIGVYELALEQGIGVETEVFQV